MSTLIEQRPVRESGHAGILAVAEALRDWFDEDARKQAIPADLRCQDGVVAIAGGRLVGFITLFFADSRPNIEWLGVAPDCRRKGIGSRLLLCAEEFGRRHGLTEIAACTLGDGVAYEPYEATGLFYFSKGFAVYRTSRTATPAVPKRSR